MLIRVFSRKIWLHLIGVIGFALLQTLALYSLVALPLGVLLIDSLIYALLGFVISIPLLNVFRFGKLELLALPLRIFNFIALISITLGITLGIVFIIEIGIIDANLKPAFISLLPLRGLFTLLTYLSVIYFFRNEEKDEDNDEETCSASTEASIDTASTSVAPETEYLERFAVKSGSKIHMILVPEIICLCADGDYVQIITEKGKFLKEQTMKYFENSLPNNQFVRVHRSCIVNIEAISSIELYEKQSQQLTLKNGEKIKVSQNGYKMLRDKLKL